MRVLSSLKSRLKAAVGRSIPRDLLEKLTEYSIGETEFSLASAKVHQPSGSGWVNIIERGREKLWADVLRERSGPILLLEFGSWRGDSMRHFARLDSNPKSRFLGFDSFEGLPEDWRGMEARRFDQGGTTPLIDDSRVRFVKGWFRDTVPPMLDELVDLARGRRLLVHFDADLYSSTLFLLFALHTHFQSYTFIFDEFSGHEARALFNFSQATGAVPIFNHRLDWEGWPQIVAGQIEPA